jgi:hypothetical protein
MSVGFIVAADISFSTLQNFQKCLSYKANYALPNPSVKAV